jgi:hypothetical protein
MSRRNESILYEKIMSQMMNLNIDYKNIKNLENFKLTIKNVVRPLFRGNYDVSRAEDFIYIGEVIKQFRQYQPDMCIPNGLGMQITWGKSYKIGNWIQGNIYGYCHIKYSDGSLYQGELGQASHQPDGMGIGVKPGETMYEGSWKNGKKHGEGVLIRFVNKTKMVEYVAKGYFDMNRPVGIHVQSIIKDKVTYLINNDFKTKEEIPTFISAQNFKKIKLTTYQPNPPRLSGSQFVQRSIPNARPSNDKKEAQIRAIKAKEALMKPDELIAFRKKNKAESLAAWKLHHRNKGKKTNDTTKKVAAPVVVEKAKPKQYLVNPDDISSEDDSDVEIICDLTDEEEEEKLRQLKKKKKKKKKKKVIVSSSEDDDDACVICMENEIDTIILECGHMAICFSCSTDKGFKRKCPICRRPIQRVKKIFRSK